jgi:hypothetical protein
MQTLHLPANYDVWLTGLKHHLDRHRGSKAELARHLETQMAIRFSTAQVKVSQLLAGSFTPSATTFLDIAAWLQQRQDALSEPPLPEDAPLPPRQAVTYWQTPPPAPAKVAEGQPATGGNEE